MDTVDGQYIKMQKNDKDMLMYVIGGLAAGAQKELEVLYVDLSDNMIGCKTMPPEALNGCSMIDKSEFISKIPFPDLDLFMFDTNSYIAGEKLIG